MASVQLQRSRLWHQGRGSNPPPPHAPVLHLPLAGLARCVGRLALPPPPQVFLDAALLRGGRLALPAGAGGGREIGEARGHSARPEPSSPGLAQPTTRRPAAPPLLQLLLLRQKAVDVGLRNGLLAAPCLCRRALLFFDARYHGVHHGKFALKLLLHGGHRQQA